jgi:nucleoside permease NupC
MLKAILIGAFDMRDASRQARCGMLSKTVSYAIGMPSVETGTLGKLLSEKVLSMLSFERLFLQDTQVTLSIF